jgi:hypothetical protein
MRSSKRSGTGRSPVPIRSASAGPVDAAVRPSVGIEPTRAHAALAATGGGAGAAERPQLGRPQVERPGG